MKGNKLRHIKRSLFACLLALSMLSAIGCGGGGGGSDTSTQAPVVTPPVVSNSNWNEFNWDDGTTWQ